MKYFTTFLLLLTQCLLLGQTFTATVNQPVPDDGTPIAFPLEITGLPTAINGSFGLVEVCLNMTHTWDSDMDVRLKAPDGTVFLLFTGIGGDGDNWESCCMRQDAGIPISSVGAPFTGVFRPMGNMGNVNNGQNPNGAWELLLYDTYAFADAGLLMDWQLSFGSGAAEPAVFPGTYLPLVLLETGGQNIPNDPKVLAKLKIINQGNGHLNLPSDTLVEFSSDILVELQGFTGPIYPKKNYDFDLVDSAGEKFDAPLLGMPAENDWILKAEYLDPSLMDNAIAYTFARRMGRYAPRTMYCEVFLDGDYIGVYTLTEKIKRDKNRVDIAKLTPQDTVGEELTGGYIIEMNHNGAPGAWDSQYLPINYNTCGLPVQYKFVEPKQSEIQPQQAAYIHSYVDSFEQSLHQPFFASPSSGYRKWIDETSFLDFMFVNEFSTNYDSYGRSTFMYKEKASDGGKLKIGPAWDYDRGFCCTTGWVWEITHPAWPFPDWWSILHSDTTFLQQRYCRWQELRNGPWQTTEFMAVVDSFYQLLATPAARNFERWPELGFAGFADTIAQRKALIANRLDWMDAQIKGESCEVPPSMAHEQVQTGWAQLSPNPSQDMVAVSISPSPYATQLQVFDLGNRQVARYEIPVGQYYYSFPVRDWMPGLYLIKISNGNKISMMKLVVL
jgi:subtilisin-like proprotein convertase family protein